MGKREKLIDRLTNSPQGATFADLRQLLEYEGFHLDRVTDTHNFFVYAETILVIPVGNHNAKTIYVQQVLALIAAADSELEDDD